MSDPNSLNRDILFLKACMIVEYNISEAEDDAHYDWCDENHIHPYYARYNLKTKTTRYRFKNIPPDTLFFMFLKYPDAKFIRR